jgi:cell division transport system ATP-binding protein
MEFSSAPIIQVKDASIYQESQMVLKEANFDIYKGEFVYLIGKTGSGKSSLLKTLYADLPLNTGDISIADHNLLSIKKAQVPFLRRKLGIIFQDFQLFYDRSVSDNLIFVMKATGWKNNVKMTERIKEVLQQVGLGSIENKMPHQLSGGEQQRLVIARSLINDPLIIIADEPTGNLDPDVAEGIMQLFLQINKGGTAILMATHNYEFLEKFQARVLKIENGELKDSAKEVFSYRHGNH